MTVHFNRRRFLTGLSGVAALAAGPVGRLGSQAASNSPRNTFSVSMNCYTWGRFDVAQCLAQIRETPIRLLELPVEQTRPKSLIPELMIEAPLGGNWQYSFPDFKALLAKDGFAAESIAVFGYTGYPGAEAWIKRRIDFAARLGARTLVLGCYHRALGHSPEPPTPQQLREQVEARSFIYAMLRDLADYAAPRNVRIALEIHGGVMANAAEALRTMKEVGRENVGVNFDTANIYFYNAGLDAAGAARELAALAKPVFHVHLKDIIRGKTQSGHVLCRLGQGEVDFRKVFEILHEVGFYGPFSFEVETFHGATKSEDIRDYHTDLLTSIEYLRSIGEFVL